MTDPDSARTLRQAKIITEIGYLPAQDDGRWIKPGRDMTRYCSLSSWTIAECYRICHYYRSPLSIERIAISFPVGCLALSVVVFYLLGRMAFGHSASLLASALYVSHPALVSRARAGFCARDSFTLLLWLLVLWTWSASIRSNGRTVYIWAVACGMFTALLGLTWEGFGLLILPISILPLFLAVVKRRLPSLHRTYFIWSGFTLFAILLLTRTYLPIWQPHVILVLLPIITGIVLSSLASRSNYSLCIQSPTKTLYVIISVLFTIIAIFALRIHVHDRAMIYRFLGILSNPQGRDRWMQTVQEVMPHSTRNMLTLFGVLCPLSVLGIVAGCRGKVSGRECISISSAAALPFLGLFLTRLSVPVHIGQTDYVNTIVFLILMTKSVGLFISNARFLSQRPLKGLESLRWGLLVELFALLVAEHGAMRFDFFFVPVLILWASYGLSKTLSRLWSRQASACAISTAVSIGLLKIYMPLPVAAALAGCLFILYQLATVHKRFTTTMSLVLALLTLVLSYGISHPVLYNIDGMHGTSKPFDSTTRASLDWIRDTLPHSSVVMARWSLGSFLNLYGQVRTIIDEDQFIPYRVHMASRHVWCADGAIEALRFLKTFNANYFYLSSSEVASLGDQQAYLGSDASGDLRSNLRSFETSRTITDLFTTDGVLHFDTPEPVFIMPGIGKSRLSRGHLLPPITGVIGAYRHHGSEWILRDAKFETMGQSLSVRKVYAQGKLVHTDTKADLPGALVFLESSSNENRLRQAIYVPEKMCNYLAIRLWLFNEPISGFHEVYHEGQALFFEAGRANSEVRIWRLDYPPYIYPDYQYLRMDFQPGALREAWARGSY